MCHTTGTRTFAEVRHEWVSLIVVVNDIMHVSNAIFTKLVTCTEVVFKCLNSMHSSTSIYHIFSIYCFKFAL